MWRYISFSLENLNFDSFFSTTKKMITKKMIQIAGMVCVGSFLYYVNNKRDRERERERNLKFHETFEKWAKKDREMTDRMYGDCPPSDEEKRLIRAEMAKNEKMLDDF